MQALATQGKLGLAGGFELTPEWQSMRLTFIARKDESRTSLRLLVGASNRSVEIADEPIVRELSGAAAAAALARLTRPDWKLSATSPAVAIMDELSPESGPPFRVRVSKLAGNDIWTVQLQYDGLPIEKGQEYIFELRVRATGPRPLQYAVSQDHAPWDNLGLWGKLDLSSEWQTVQRTFVATRDDPSGRLILALGSSTQAVEVAAVRLVHGKQELLPVRTP